MVMGGGISERAYSWNHHHRQHGPTTPTNRPQTTIAHLASFLPIPPEFTHLSVLEGHDLVAGAVDDEERRLDVRDAVDVGEQVAAEGEAQREGHPVDREDGALLLLLLFFLGGRGGWGDDF